MTDEEILEARRKIAEHPVFQPRQTEKQQVREETPKYHRPAGTPTYYKPMTAEEIKEEVCTVSGGSGALFYGNV